MRVPPLLGAGGQAPLFSRVTPWTNELGRAAVMRRTPTRTQTADCEAHAGDIVRVRTQGSPVSVRFPPALPVTAGQQIAVSADGLEPVTLTAPTAVRGPDGRPWVTTIGGWSEWPARSYQVLESDGAGSWHVLHSRVPDTVVDLRDFGSVSNGDHDDTLAFKAAVRYLTNADGTKCGGGRIFVPSGTRITDTIVFNRMAVILEGDGWGDAPGLVWGGAAGIPMLQFTDCYGVFVRDLWLYGSKTNQPSALLNLYRTALHTVGTNGQFFFNRVLLGSPKWYDATPAQHAAVGLLMDGTNGNNDQWHVVGCDFSYLATGIYAPNSQSIWTHVEDSCFGLCTSHGIHTAANLNATKVGFNRCGTDGGDSADITTIDTARVFVRYWESENSGCIAYLGESSLLAIDCGTIDLGSIVGGKFIHGDPTVRYEANARCHIQSFVGENLIFRNSNGTDTISLKPAVGADIAELIPRIELRNVRELTLPTQLDVDPVDSDDARRVIIDCEGYSVDTTLRFPDHLSVAAATPEPYIPFTDTDTTNLMNAVNALIAVSKKREESEWREDPDSALLGDNEGWYSAEKQGETAGSSVATVTDYSGNSRDLTQATAGYQPIARGSGAGSYFEFDGSDDHVDSATAADWQFLHEAEWTFGMVVRIPVTDYDDGVCLAGTWSGNSADDGTSIEYEDRHTLYSTNNRIRIRTCTDGTVSTVQTPDDAFLPNTWHTLIVWRHSNVITIEVDGVVVKTETVAAPTTGTAPAGPLRIGTLVGGSGPAQEDVASVAIFSRSFSRHWLAAIRYHLDAVRSGL